MKAGRDEVRQSSEEACHLVLTPAAPNPEVPTTATRRRFTAEYKLGILKRADECTAPGDIGRLLRREGLYASNLKTWRRQREEGELSALKPRKRGRKEADRNPLIEENEKLRRDNERLAERLRRAEIIIEVQKKYPRCWGQRPRKEGSTDGGRHRPVC